MSAPAISIAHGIPLSEEQGIGALTLGEWLREVTQAHAEREALVLWQGDIAVRWSYAQLWERALEVARTLVACGLGKGARVGILATNRPEFLSCFFGAALAGGVATTISTFFTAAELEEVLGKAGLSVLLVERNVLKKDFAEMLGGIEPAILSAAPGQLQSRKFPWLRHVAFVDSDDGMGCIEGWSTFRNRAAGVAPETIDAIAGQIAPSDPGILFFSSGSTGKVKGILSSHRGVCLQLWRWPQWYDVKPENPPRMWSANGFFWSGNFAMALGGALSSGGALILQRWFDAEEALDLMQREKATFLNAWPHQWAQLEGASNYPSVDLSSLYYIDRDTPIGRHPTVNTPWKEPAQAYGNTETFTLISVFASGTDPELAVPGSHGHPTAGSTVKIVAPLTGETVPIGERGEIAVKGPTLMLGYVGVPLDQSLDAEGFLRCGDGGYIDTEGRLFWEGRLNDIIKTGGANVSPLEIDAVLRDCPGVKISQTVGVPDELLGEMVVGCIVRHAGQVLDEAAIRAFGRERLASYKVPRRVLFFAEDELGTTGSAKIKTDELRKLAAARLAEERA